MVTTIAKLKLVQLKVSVSIFTKKIDWIRHSTKPFPSMASKV